MKTPSKRFWLPLVGLAVLAILALGGCAQGANTGNAPGNQTTTSQSAAASTSDEINRVQQIDQQNPNDSMSLDSDDQNANQYFGSDQEVQLIATLSMGTTATPAASAASCTTVSCVQQFGDQRIQERLTGLEKLKDVAQNHKALTDPQRTLIINDANTNEAGLKNLKSKLDSETDIKAAAADVKNIYVQFRIFAVVLPRDYGEIELFHEQNLITRGTNAEPTITNLIQKDQNAGHDVTKLNALYQDYTAKLQDATNQTNAAQALIPSLVPANYPGTDQTLKTYRADLKAAHDDLKDAANDLHRMYQILKKDLGGLKRTPTPTPGS